MRLRASLALVLVVLLTVGCQADVQLNVDVHGDGTGVVELAVGFDDDAVEELGGLRRQPRLDDLEQAGWSVVGPRKEDDGRTWIRVSKPFGNPDEASDVLEELSGEDGPLRDFKVTRDDAFARTRWDFSGTWDFKQGGITLSDPALTEALDGAPLGQSLADYERKHGAPIDKLVRIDVAVRLPGNVTSNAPVEASNGAKWRLSLRRTEPIALRASGRDLDKATLAWAAGAAVAGVALLVLLTLRLARWRRRRSA